MPSKVKNYEFRRVQNSRYGWEEYMDGEAYRFVHGEDFQCKPESFYNLVFKVARDAGKGVRINMEDAKRDKAGNVTSCAYVVAFVDKDTAANGKPRTRKAASRKTARKAASGRKRAGKDKTRAKSRRSRRSRQAAPTEPAPAE